MNAVPIAENWALWAAVVPAAIVAAVVGSALWRRSAPGRLRTVLRRHRKAVREIHAANRRVSRAAAHLEKLESNRSAVRPRVLEEAKGALQDAMALAKIATDRVLVTANHVRRVIHEEFPPSRQPALMKRYLPDDGPDGRPFSFDA